MLQKIPVLLKAVTPHWPSFCRRATPRALTCLALLLPALAWGQVQTPTTITPISLGTSAYTQDFNILASTSTSSVVPAGVGFVETNVGTGTTANNTYTAITISSTGSGSSGTGETYSFGAGTTATTDRALGSVRSGSLASQYGFAFTNTTGSVITSLAVSYTGETYRLAGSTPARGSSDRLDFQYSTDATSLTTGTFIDVDPLDYVGPVNNVTSSTGFDGNDPANRTVVTGTITGLSIAAGATFYIRYVDFDAPGADDGLAIDDFSITASTSTPCNAAFTYSNASYCTSGANPTPTVTGTAGGTFSSTTGLTISSTTGAITLSSSTPGTYTVTYTLTATCNSTATVTISGSQSAAFSYSGSPYCTSVTASQAPVLATGSSAGTFTSTTGLTLNATTGAITPSTSTAGTYTVTNTVAANGAAPPQRPPQP